MGFFGSGLGGLSSMANDGSRDADASGVVRGFWNTNDLLPAAPGTATYRGRWANSYAGRPPSCPPARTERRVKTFELTIAIASGAPWIIPWNRAV